jgi:hypothetical protein
VKFSKVVAVMDAEQRLELIRLLAEDKAWQSVVLADVFDGSSGGSGPEYVTALRRALERIDEGRK